MKTYIINFVDQFEEIIHCNSFEELKIIASEKFFYYKENNLFEVNFSLSGRPFTTYVCAFEASPMTYLGHIEIEEND